MSRGIGERSHVFILEYRRSSKHKWIMHRTLFYKAQHAADLAKVFLLQDPLLTEARVVKFRR